MFESSITLHVVSSRISVPNEAKDVILNIFNIITIRNESQILLHVIINGNLILENGIRIKSEVAINSSVSVKVLKRILYAKKIIFGILVYALVRLIMLI